MTSGKKAVILKLFQGGSDPRHKSCSHDWKEFKERGCKKNKIYYYCPCGLVCTVNAGASYHISCFKTFIGETTPAIEKGLCCGDKRMAMDCKECDKEIPWKADKSQVVKIKELLKKQKKRRKKK